jgi:hypothetical protein
MTRSHLRWVLVIVIALYANAIGVGVALRRPFDKPRSTNYDTYKDLLPLVIAIPAAYLAFAFQRRNSYLQALRGLWSKIVSAIADALVYADTTTPTEEQFLEVRRGLSIAMEEVRGVFKNIPVAGEPDGAYPFEPVREVYKEIGKLGFGADATPARRAAVREEVYRLWKVSRSQMLAEFDRDEPTHHYMWYAGRSHTRHDGRPPSVSGPAASIDQGRTG